MSEPKKKKKMNSKKVNSKNKVVKSRVAVKMEKEKNVKQQKRKIKVFRVLLVFSVIITFSFFIYFLLQIPIRSIVIKGNKYLSDQQIIDMAGIRNYPSTLRTTTSMIKKSLESQDLILEAKVQKKKFLTKTVITIIENKPLFYYQPENRVVLQDGTKIEGNYTIPTVLNQIPDSVYEKFLDKMNGVPNDVLRKVSEIRYYPVDVDSELFLMIMNDGNYVYATLPKFERFYHYLEYVEGFDNKKGILHLDSGDYLEILEEN